MPKAEFFTRLGLFAIKEFFDAGLCAKLRTEARLATSQAATVVGKDGKGILDEKTRTTKCTQVSQETIAYIKLQLLAVKPQLESHFHVKLKDCEKPQLLRYHPGGFYVPHPDSNHAENAPQYLKERKVSTVIYLNSEVDKYAEECYTGGALTLYGLIEGERWQKYGFHLMGEAGLLIAFPSDILHQVEPVIEGERYTIVTWFF